MTKARAHIDGCHFFVWVAEDGRMSYDERTGSNLVIHGQPSECGRCKELQYGAEAYSETRTLSDMPDDAKGFFVYMLGVIAELQEAYE